MIAIIDWGIIDQTLFVPRPASLVLSENRPLAEQLSFLEEKEGLFRVYSPSYSLPQQTVAENGLQLADGVDPLYLQAYAEFMEQATGVPSAGYSVTIPPFGHGDPSMANALYSPDPALLGILNVRFIATEFDLQVDGLVYEGEYQGTRLYRNLHAMPRIWVQSEAGASDAAIHTDSINWSPDQIEFQADGPGLVVLSEVIYPGWQVRVDDKPAEIVPFQRLLRSVHIGPGLHTVNFKFRPLSLYIGLGVGILAWLGLVLSWYGYRRSKP